MIIHGPHGPVALSGYVEKMPADQNYRFKEGKGLQIYNADTARWHTLIAVGDPATLMLDDGEIE